MTTAHPLIAPGAPGTPAAGATARAARTIAPAALVATTIALDEHAIRRRKADKKRRYLSQQVPILRLIGFLILWSIVAFERTGMQGSWQSLALVGAAFVAYSLGSWLVTLVAPDAYLSVMARAFLILDPFLWMIAVYMSGGEKSWLFTVVLARVADQLNTNRRKALAFTGVGVLAYLSLLAYVMLADGRSIDWSEQLGRIAFLVGVGVYLSMTAGAAERLRDQLADAVRTARDSIRQLQAQSLVESIARDRDRKLMLERLYRDAVNEAQNAPAPVAARASDPATATTARQQLAAAKANLAALELKYTADHPDVSRARRLVQELQPKADAEVAAAKTVSAGDAGVPSDGLDVARRESLRQQRAEIESLERQIVFKEGEEQKIRTQIAEYNRRLEAVPGLESEWASLTRDYDTQQQAYRDLLAKSSAAELAKNLEDQNIGERFRIVDPAEVPIRPLPSLRIRYNAVGFAVGLLFGAGIALLLELRDKTFRTDTDVLEVLMLPVLAAVPRVETAAEKLGQRRRRLAASLAGLAGVSVAGYVTWALKLWNSVWYGLPTEEFRGERRRLEAACREIGRDPAEIRKNFKTQGLVFMNQDIHGVGKK